MKAIELEAKQEETEAVFDVFYESWASSKAAASVDAFSLRMRHV
jgi:hypothetical protein